MQQIQSAWRNLSYWQAVLILTFVPAAAQPARAQVTISGITQQVTTSAEELVPRRFLACEFYGLLKIGDVLGGRPYLDGKSYSS